MWCLCPCQAQVQVEDKNAILDVGVWTDKTRKNDASSPSNTEMRYICCAHAIVTMRAYCQKDDGTDGYRQWEDLKRESPVRQRQAQELHREAGVVKGPCSLKELLQFQQSLGSQYQLLVMTRIEPFFLIFKVPTAAHQIRLVKSNHHFDRCTSFPAFVNRSYYCLDCERGFNTNDSTNHSC